MVTVPKNRILPVSPEEARRSHLESLFWRQALLWGLKTIPAPLRQASMPLWSAFFYAQVPHIRRAIESNQRRLAKNIGSRSLGSVRAKLLAFRTFTNYCRCIANAYSFYAGMDIEVPVRVSGIEHLEQALAAGGGAVVATGHLGNWHLGPHFLDRHGFPPVTVVMHEEPDRNVQELENQLRDRRMQVVYSSRSPLLNLELRAALRRGELVAFQVDRPAASGGITVRCGSERAIFATGPAALARTCGVPIVPVFFPLDRRGVHIIVEPPLTVEQSPSRDADLRSATAALAAVYMSVLRRYPDQWFNFYEFWNGDADVNRSRQR